MIDELFSQLGYSKKEIQVYLALAEQGKTTASVISKVTKIPRATVYTILDSLINRGAALSEHVSSKTLFLASPPASFCREIDREREEINGKEKAAKELARVLTPYLKNVETSLPRLNSLEGQRNIDNFLYEALPEWRKSTAATGDFTLWGYQDHTFVQEYRRWHDHLWKTKSSKERIRLFSNPSDIEKELLHKIPNREVRALPEGVHFKSSIWLYGDFIFMAMTRERPHYAFHIRNEMFASNLRTIFQLLWNARF